MQGAGVHLMSQAHAAELNNALGTSQTLFRRQLDGLRERLLASNAQADSSASSSASSSTPTGAGAGAPPRMGGSGPAPTLEEIKKTFEARRVSSAMQMKKLLASIDPSLALY